jgi:hypothetical protein
VTASRSSMAFFVKLNVIDRVSTDKRDKKFLKFLEFTEEEHKIKAVGTYNFKCRNARPVSASQ